MDKYCSNCGTELVVADTATYCPFCTIIKKKPMKTFFIRWKNGLEERLPGTSITNVLVVARYGAAAINALDYYTVDNDPAKMYLTMPEIIKKDHRRTHIHIMVYTDSRRHRQLIGGFDDKDVAKREKDRYTENNTPTAPLNSFYSVETLACWIKNR